MCCPGGLPRFHNFMLATGEWSDHPAAPAFGLRFLAGWRTFACRLWAKNSDRWCGHEAGGAGEQAVRPVGFEPASGPLPKPSAVVGAAVPRSPHRTRGCSGRRSGGGPRNRSGSGPRNRSGCRAGCPRSQTRRLAGSGPCRPAGRVDPRPAASAAFPWRDAPVHRAPGTPGAAASVGMLIRGPLLEFFGNEPQQSVGRFRSGELHALRECGLEPKKCRGGE